VALALLAGVRPRDLANLELKAPWSFLLAALLEGGLSVATSRNLISPGLAGPLAQLLVVGLVGYGLLQNSHLRSLWFVALGFVLNGLVIAANGGHMPVSGIAVEQLGGEKILRGLEQQADAVHGLMNPGTPLWFLGDTIPLRLLGRKSIISLGDVYLMVGIILTIMDGGLEAKRKAKEGLQIDLKF